MILGHFALRFNNCATFVHYDWCSLPPNPNLFFYLFPPIADPQARLKASMEGQFQAQQAELQAKIAELEGKLGG
jgi:hypothetical protein